MSDERIDAEALNTELQSAFDKLLRKQVVISELEDFMNYPDDEDRIAALRVRLARAAVDVFTRPH